MRGEMGAQAVGHDVVGVQYPPDHLDFAGARPAGFDVVAVVVAVMVRGAAMAVVAVVAFRKAIGENPHSQSLIIVKKLLTFETISQKKPEIKACEPRRMRRIDETSQ
jgi:hypothetical protein